MGAVLAVLSLSAAPAMAQVITDGGALAPDVPQSVTFADTDATFVYSITVPAGATPTVTFSDATRPGEYFANLRYDDGELGGGWGYFPSDPTTAFAELRAHPDPAVAHPATLRITGAFGGSSTSFVLHYVSDVAVDVAPGTATTLALTEQGQRGRLSFDATAGDAVSVTVLDDTLAATVPRPGTGRFTLTLLPQLVVLTEFQPQQFGIERVAATGRQTLVVDPAFDLAGSLTLTVNVIPAGVPIVGYAQEPQQTTIDTPGTAARAAFVAKGGAATVVQAAVPSLTRGDGTPGAADLVLDLPGRPSVTLGRVTDRTVAFPTAAPLDAGTLAFVRVVGVGDTTGTLGLRVFLDPGPSTPLTIGTSTPVEVPAGSRTKRFSLDLAKGDGLEMFVSDLVVGDPDIGFAQARVEDEVGAVLWDSPLFPGTGVGFVAPAAGTFTLILTAPGDRGLTATLLPTVRTVKTVPAALGFDQVVTVDAPAQNLELPFALAAGETAGITVEDVSGTDTAAGASIVDENGLSNGTVQVPVGSSTFLESARADAATTLKLVIDPSGPATGSYHVTITRPVVVTGVLDPAGTPTKLTVGTPGGLGRWTFEGTAGQPFALDVGELVADPDPGFPFASLVVTGPDGQFVLGTNAFPGQPTWVELPDGLPATGTYTLTLDPSGRTTGSVTVTRITPRTVTSAATVGTVQALSFTEKGLVRSLTFSGRKGQRPLLDLPNQTMNARVRLLAPSGLSLLDAFNFSIAPYYEPPVLTETGTWTLVVDPFDAETGTLDVGVSLTTDPVRTVADGDKVTVRFAKGQNPVLRIDAVKGTHLALDIASVLPPGTTVEAQFIRPNGSLLQAIQFDSGGQWVEPLFTPTDVTGRWSIVLDPQGPAAGSVTARVRAATDKVITGRLGKTTTIDVKAPARNVVLPFKGVPSIDQIRTIHYKVTDSTFRGYVWVMTPSGTLYALAFIGTGTTEGDLSIPNEINGTWALVVDPEIGSTGRARVFFDYGPFTPL